MAQSSIDEAYVLERSERYGELDGQIAALYAEAFTKVFRSLTPQQLAKIEALNPLEGYECNGAFLFSEQVAMPTIEDTSVLFR